MEDSFPPFSRPEVPDTQEPPSLQFDLQTIVGIGLVGVLVLVGLMLPPVSLGKRVFAFGYQRISAGNPAVIEDGLTVSLVEPDGSLRVKVSTVLAESFNDRQAGPRWGKALDALLPTQQLLGPIYELDGRGQPSSGILLDVAVPAGGSSPDALDLYAWDPDQSQWVFVPSVLDATTNTLRAELAALPGSVAVFDALPGTPLLSVVQEPGQTLDAELGAAINVLMPAGLQPAPDGSLTGTLAAGAIGDFAVVPLVRNYTDLGNVDVATASAILADVNVQQTHLNTLVELVVAGGNDGLALDYRGLTVEQEPAYTAFVTTLADLLHEEGKILVVVLPPPTPGSDATTWETGGYNWRALGEAADMLEVQPGPAPGDYASTGRGGQMLTWATSEVSRSKLYLGVSTHSIDVVNGTVGVPVPYQTARERLVPIVDPPLPADQTFSPGQKLSFTLGGEGVTSTALDPASGIAFYRYEEGGQHEVWLMTAGRLSEQLSLASTYKLAGVVVHDLLAENGTEGVTQAVVGFKVNAPIVPEEPMQVEWVFKNQNKTLSQKLQPFGDDVSWSSGSVEGKVRVLASLIDPNKHEQGDVSFTVGAAPVEEEPEPTPEPQAAAPAAAAAPAETAPEPAPPPPAAAASTAEGGFELGGQTNTLENPDLMRDAGMTWVKFQRKWTPGASGYEVDGLVSLGHDNGFKVLISVPGPLEPASIDYDAYVQYVREVAETGADGIEIWNEMNLSREWPAGEISGTNYVNNMLAPAYNAIKSVDPSVLVISGALAPTGAFGGCGDVGFVSGCDDWYYNQQMAEAGAANFMDCVGIHFNAGATSPSAASGHPADGGDGHYTWYYSGMVNAYSVVGKPLCFTELGYLSDDGYPGVDGTTFDWGKYTTVDQQAAWLAETVSLAKSYARLLIVWNVDIFTYDPSDPQGGYAIVRPDGTCPACDALGAVAP